MSNLRRFFVDKIENPLTISGEEFFHAVNVLRLKQGEEIIVCDNTGMEYTCNVTSISKKELTAEVLTSKYSTAETSENVMLITGYLKGDKTELVVQKAVELGVKKIVVFSSQFSSAYINENKLARLQRVAVESSKQCGRAIVPTVEYAKTLSSALSFGKDYKNKLFACEFATKNEVDFSSLAGSTAVVVGSEGGFSKQEWELSTSLGYKTVFLGSRILRAETACIALTAITMHSLKELE